MIISRSIHVEANGIAFVFTAEQQPQCSTVCVHQVFFTHSSAGGHLGYFHVLVIVNSAVVSIGVHYLFELQFYLDICLWVASLDHMETLF